MGVYIIIEHHIADIKYNYSYNYPWVCIIIYKTIHWMYFIFHPEYVTSLNVTHHTNYR